MEIGEIERVIVCEPIEDPFQTERPDEIPAREVEEVPELVPAGVRTPTSR